MDEKYFNFERGPAPLSKSHLNLAEQLEASEEERDDEDGREDEEVVLTQHVVDVAVDTAAHQAGHNGDAGLHSSHHVLELGQLPVAWVEIFPGLEIFP